MPRSGSVDGFRLAYARHGGGTPVVLLHGWPGSAADYTAVRARLADDGADVIVPDLRGFGESDRPAEVDAYGIPLSVKDMVLLLENADGKAAIIRRREPPAATPLRAFRL